MSTDIKISLERALAIADEAARLRNKYGKLGAGALQTKYRPDEVEAALVTLADAVNSRVDAVTMDEVTKLRRQLAAANARVARLSKGKDEPETRARGTGEFPLYDD